MNNRGRKRIYTNVKEITYDNIISVVQRAIGIHYLNASDCQYLLKYEKGEQPLQRKKIRNPQVDITCIDNVASEIAKFKIGYHFGNPITLVQRGNSDSGKDNVSETDGISLLNEQYAIAGIRKKTNELARFIEICGIGYTFVDVNSNYTDGDSIFTVDVVEPMSAFIIYSNYYIDKRPMVGVVFGKDEDGNTRFSCFTNDSRYEVIQWKVVNGEKLEEERWNHDVYSGEINPLGKIPLVEWNRDTDLTGCFERQIESMDSLNIAESDFLNAADEVVNSIWHTNDVDFPEEEYEDEDGTKHTRMQTPIQNTWLQTFTSKDGKTPFIKPLNCNYDYSGNLNFITTQRSMILQKCNVPLSNINSSGGSTGIAMSDATGWSQAEVEASMQQGIIEDCKMQEVDLVLRAIRINLAGLEAGHPLLNLRTIDIKPNIKRQKTYEMTVKVNAYATMVSHGIAPKHAISSMNYFDDPNQVATDSEPYIERYLRSAFGENNTSQNQTEEKLMVDHSAQIENSPMLDKSRG